MAADLTEFLAEYERLMAREPDADGFTSEEWAGAWGCSVFVARRRLKEGMKAGVVRLSGMKTVARMDGRANPTPAYALVAPPAKKSKGR